MATALHAPQILRTPTEGGWELEETAAIVAVREFLETTAPILVLAGSVGTGKSMAAASGLYAWRERFTVHESWGHARCSTTTAWIAAPKLARLAPWAPEIEELEAADLLVLDDLGEEALDEKSKGVISSLLTARHAAGLRTIITTNTDRPTFKSRYGDRITDRIREGGLKPTGGSRWWVACTGPSLRGVMAPKYREPPPRPEPERWEPTEEERARAYDGFAAALSIGGEEDPS